MSNAKQQASNLPARFLSAVLLTLEGKTPPEIAEELGYRRETVWKWLQREDVQAELQRQVDIRLEDARSEVRAATLEAVRVLVGIMRDGAPDQARMAAVAILDRGGMGASSTTEVETKGDRPMQALGYEQLVALLTQAPDGDS